MQGGGETGTCRGAALHVGVWGGGGRTGGSSEACKGVGKQGNCRGAGLHVGGGVRLRGGIEYPSTCSLYIHT